MFKVLAIVALQFAPSATTGLAIKLATQAAAVILPADCVGMATPDHFQVQKDGATKVYGPIVPVDEVWLVEAASVYTPNQNPAQGAEFMLEIIEPVPEQTGGLTAADPDDVDHPCCWRIGVAKQVGAFATPFGVMGRAFVLRAGQRMAARTNGPLNLAIAAVTFRYPAGCLGALVLR